jgi:hypothetical protein
VGIESRDWYRADPPQGVGPSAPRPDTKHGPPWWAWIIGALTMGGVAAWIADRYFDYHGDPIADAVDWIVSNLPI